MLKMLEGSSVTSYKCSTENKIHLNIAFTDASKKIRTKCIWVWYKYEYAYKCWISQLLEAKCVNCP